MIDISLEEYLVKGLCLPPLAKGCQTCGRFGKSVVAKVCKSLHLNFDVSPKPRTSTHHNYLELYVVLKLVW